MDSVNDSVTESHWVSPFGYRRLAVHITLPALIADCFTPFIASDCRGIHRVRLIKQPHSEDVSLRVAKI